MEDLLLSDDVFLSQEYCFFLDILGYRDMARRAEDKQEVFLSVRKALKAARKTLDNPVDWKLLKVKSFSDNTVISLKYTQGSMGLASLLEFTCNYQAELIDHGMVCRGGGALGDFYLEEDMVYGSALIEAYEIESEKAVYPMVMLSKHIMDKLNEENGFLAQSMWSKKYHDWYFVQANGNSYVNYLKSAFKAAKDRDDVVHFWFDYRLMQKHKFLIEENLRKYEQIGSVHSKYVFLSEYHNYFLSFCKGEDGYYDELLVNYSGRLSFLQKKEVFGI